MLKPTFDPKRSYRAVIYARMSSDNQNPRSPEQQIQEITRRMQASGFRWTVVKTYRDDGVSGRYVRKRPGYQQMMQDLKGGTVVADLILVDTIERLGRVEELPTIRRELYERDGVLVLTADSSFADPNTPQGKALVMVESMRATEDGRIKAHNVLRGKRDAAQQKHWPGGPPPFGYMLKSVMKRVHNREEVDFCVLEPDPATRWIIELLFETAEQASFGPTRLARALNNDPRIPDGHKPFQPETIGYWLDSAIYYGDLYWGKHATGIVDDTRVVKPNEANDILYVAEFCEPLVSRERWNNVQAIRQVRRERSRAARRPAASPEKQIQAPAPGMTLRYLLSGLVYCECGLRMTASSSSAYTAKDGSQRQYTSYVCHGYLGGHCPNGTRVPERWIRSVVIDKLRERLFPESRDWLPELKLQIESHLERLSSGRHDARPALQQELDQIEERIGGWSQSLAQPDLPVSVRQVVHTDMAAASDRKNEIVAELHALDHDEARSTQLVADDQVRKRLDQLAVVLGNSNPTRGNLELSLHIDRIVGHRDGSVTLRMCKLGIAPDAVALLSQPVAASKNGDTNGGPAKARRRSKLRIIEEEGTTDLQAQANFIADSQRFAGLGDDWFWVDEFTIPVSKSWAATHAEAVFLRRQVAQLSYGKLAAEFGVTKPTIKAAIRCYLEAHPDARDEVCVQCGGKRRPKLDIAKFADEARQLWLAGWSQERLAKKFDCSPPTVVKAIKLAYRQDGLSMPTAAEARSGKAAAARRLHDAGASLAEIAAAMNVSDVTARGYLRASFAAEGTTMPDLRRRDDDADRSPPPSE